MGTDDTIKGNTDTKIEFSKDGSLLPVVTNESNNIDLYKIRNSINLE